MTPSHHHAFPNRDGWAERIGRHVTAEGSVVVPPRIAHWLEQKAGVTDDRRIAIRATDPLAYEVLAALHLAALHHRSGIGTKDAVAPQKPPQLELWLTTSEAATEMGVTDRAIRKWIATDRLPARRHGGRWLIKRNDIHIQALAA
jgi:excisionase family DNA binding protein